MKTSVEGICALHAVVGPSCRALPSALRGPDLEHLDPHEAAFEAAVGLLRREYLAVCAGRKDGWRGHLVLTIEGP